MAVNYEASTISPLEALLELARSASEDPLPLVLQSVTDTIHRTAGFDVVVLNVYRSAWDDYKVELVVGERELRSGLLGTALSRDALANLLSDQEPRLPGVFFLAGDSARWEEIKDNVYTPPLPRSDDPEAWQAEDGLIVTLSDADGAPLAFVSVDEPVSGRRPTDAQLRVLRAICSHAAQALGSARRAERAAENQRMQSLLIAASPKLSGCATTDELLATVGDTVVPDLGFERVVAYSAGDGRAMHLALRRGWDSDRGLAPALSVRRIEALLAPDRERGGCWLLPAQELFGRSAARLRSRRNGRGPAAWSDHCLVVPWRMGGDSLHGLIVIEDPIDRLRPSDDRRRAVRLLVELASAAQDGIDHRAGLAHLANHDPLTGVRNRRALDEFVSAHRDVALLLCDLDHFKDINDRYGHELGDRVLARFGELLRELARDSDVPIRLGGEEFCVVLPDTDRTGAVAAAERLRVATLERLRDLVPEGVTVSIGVAITSRGVLDVRQLLAAADRNLYTAKQTGRDRSVAD